jgi:DNA repair exonuclease SbcCD nuclease subunit
MDKEAEAMRAEDVFRVFGDMIQSVIKDRAHLLLVAGDLFARTNIQRETISRVLEWFAAVHEKLPHTRIVLTPGEDEVLVRKDGSVDCTLSVFEHLSYVDVIGRGPDCDRKVYDLNGQDVTVGSCPFELFFEPDFTPRRILPVKRGCGIFLLHAYARRRRLLPLDTNEFKERVLEPLAARGYRYVALGHNHSLGTIEHDNIMAVYPGSLERLAVDEDRGKKYFVTFTIDRNGAPGPPEPVRTRVRPLEYITLSCSLGEDSVPATLDDMAGSGGKEKILYLVLEGQMAFDAFNKFRNSETLASLRQRYAAVHLDNRLVLADRATGYDFNALRVGAPAEEFRRFMEREMAQATDGSEEKRLLAELFEMGMREIEQDL